MSPILFALLVLGGSPADQAADKAAPAQATQPVDSTRTGGELREAVHQALRRWAQPSDQQADAAAREFLALYKDLQADKQLSSSQRESLLSKVRGRLEQLSQQISKRIAREKRLAQNKAAKPQGDAAQGGSLYSPGQPGPSSSSVASAAPAGARGGRGVPDDAGQDLVDLIQTVISPASWDINGGNGSIYYWSHGHALVIRQTGEVHDEIADVLGQLRRAGP
jgi:Skp family chaperone for outer membrane proteins